MKNNERLDEVAIKVISYFYLLFLFKNLQRNWKKTLYCEGNLQMLEIIWKYFKIYFCTFSLKCLIITKTQSECISWS